MPAPTPEQAYAALQAGGLRAADPDIVRMLDLTQPDFVERARAAKPYLFWEAAKPGTTFTSKTPASFTGGRFDARTAKPDEVEARLAELTRSTFANRAAAVNARVIAELKNGQ